MKVRLEDGTIEFREIAEIRDDSQTFMPGAIYEPWIRGMITKIPVLKPNERLQFSFGDDVPTILKVK